MTTLKISD